MEPDRSSRSSDTLDMSQFDNSKRMSQMPEADEVNRLYEQVLESLLTPGAIKAKLMESQSLEKKWQTVVMHNKDVQTIWGEREQTLLVTLNKARTPNINNLSRLRAGLQSANKEFMRSFLSAGGVAVLMRAIQKMKDRDPFTDYDFAIMYEIMMCFRAVMNNSIGMDGIINIEGTVDTIATCLRFENKVYSLTVIEILSVCCYYSEVAAMKVMNGMRELAKINYEAPFANLANALGQCDVEVKASVMQFVNTMVGAVADFNSHAQLRSELNAVQLGQRFDEALETVTRETMEINATSATGGINKLRRRSMVSLYGSRASFEEKGLAHHTKGVVARSRSMKIVQVSPLEGTMAGILTVAKEKGKIFTRNTNLRWYELDSHAFKWCKSHHKEIEFKDEIPVAEIIDIKSTTNNIHIKESCKFGFEIETAVRLYAFGAEKEEEVQNWVAALTFARDDFLLQRGASKLAFKPLETEDAIKFYEMFKKNGTVYQSLSLEDRSFMLNQCGLDMADTTAVYKYLYSECLASGLLPKLLAVMHELLLIPTGSDGTWDAVLKGMELLRKSKARVKQDADTSFGDDTVLDLLTDKMEDSGSAYKQMSKLALAAIAKDDEIDRLQQRIDELEEEIRYNEETRENSILSVDGQGHRPSIMSYQKLLNTHASFDQVPEMNKSNKSKPPTNGLAKTKITDLFPTIIEEGEEGAAVSSESKKQNELEESKAIDPLQQYINQLKSIHPLILPIQMKYDGYNSNEVEEFIKNGNITHLPTGIPVEPIDINVSTVGKGLEPPAPVATVDPKFAKYEKMKKMLPEGAVRQKMMVEGISQEDIDKFFKGEIVSSGENDATVPPQPPAPVVDERYAKYDRMRKMLPEGAVRQKMMVEGFTSEEIDGYFNGNIVVIKPVETSTQAPIPAAVPVVDERYVKYDKMRKILPEGAVRQKMKADGFPDEDIEKYFNGENGAPASTVTPAPVVDERYVKYDKMRKMLPEGAVRQKMKTDGFSDDDIEKYFSSASNVGSSGAPAEVTMSNLNVISKGTKPAATTAVKIVKKGPEPEIPPEGMKAKPVIKTNVKLKGVFWSKIKSAEIKDTLWYQLPEFDLSTTDISIIEEWFAAKLTTKLPLKMSNISGDNNNQHDSLSLTRQPSVPKLISVLDSKRTQNWLIIMGKIRLGPDEIIKLVIDLDPNALTLELTNTLLSILPTPEELTAVKAYSSPDTLCPASKLLFHFNTIPRLQNRIEAHETAFSWSGAAKLASAQLGVVQLACDELEKSQKAMEKVLSIILSVGNYINGDTIHGQAYGVKLDVFTKMNNLKSVITEKGSLMNFFAQLTESHNMRDIMMISESWIGIWGAADVSLKQLLIDINQLETLVNKTNQ
eukprot:gene7973-10813_t